MRQLTLIFLISPFFLLSQNVGIGTLTPENSSALEISSSDKGFLIPRNDTANIISPALGLMTYQLSDKSIYLYNGNKWKFINKPNNIIIDGDEDTYISIDDVNDTDEIRFYLKDTLHMELDNSHLGLHHGISNLSIGRNAGISDDLTNNFNTNIGTEAGLKNISGIGNTNIGAYAGKNNISGVSNTNLGAFAGNVGGARNVNIGYSAGYRNDSIGNVNLGTYAGANDYHGYNSVHIGYFSAHLDTSSIGNVYLGAYAGANPFAVHDKGYNVLLGNGAGYRNTSSRNVMVGFNSGWGSVGEGNVFLGHEAGRNDTVDNRLIIENGLSDLPLIYGEFDNEKLIINGDVTIPDDSFLVGRDSMPENGEVVSDTLLFFSKGKSALRGGRLFNSSNWAPDSTGFFSFGFGLNVKASGYASSAIGSETTASGYYSFASGTNTTASGYSSFASGFNTTASGFSSFASGRGTTAKSLVEFTLGRYNTDYTPFISDSDWYENDRLFVIGNGTNPNSRSDAMVVLKNGDVSFPDGSFLVGRDSMPKNGENAFGNILFYSDDKFALRGGRLWNSSNWAPDSIGDYSFGFGYNVKALNQYSFALGYTTTASGKYSFASGDRSIASGDYSIAFGEETTASGDYSIASGFESVAIGKYSFASGYQSTSLGQSSFAFGYQDTASGDYSFALGIGSIASGFTSFSAGSETTASGSFSFTSGRETKAKSFAEFTVGAYNTDYIPISTTSYNTNDRLFVIGNGITDLLRSDAMVVLKNGNTTLNGEFKIHAASANPDANLYMQAGSLSEGRVLAVQPSGNFLMGDIDNIGDNLYIRAGGAERITVLDNGRVGVGVVDPLSILHVKGDTYFESDGSHLDLWAKAADGTSTRWMSFSNTTKDIFLGGINDTGADLILRSGGNDRMRILNNGNVGIGLNDPEHQLELSLNSAAKPGSNTWSISSDARLKQNVVKYQEGLSSIMKVNPVQYHYNKASGYDTNIEYIGVIAQELLEVAPYMVSENAKGYLSVDNGAMTYMLINAVQELNQELILEQSENKKIRAELEELKQTIKSQETLLQGVVKRLEKLENIN